MEPFVGQIQAFGFSWPPRGWAKCDGQLLPIAQNQALFSLLGTTYGGDGRTTFGLPDLRGRLPMHHGAGPGLPARAIGERGGTNQVTLVASQMPQHDHGLATAEVTFALSDSPPTTGEGEGNSLANGTFYAPGADKRYGGVALSGRTQPAGSGTPVNTTPPFTTINYCIALVGIYPSRN